MTRSAILLLSASLLWPLSAGAEVQTAWYTDARFRYELQDQLSADPALDSGYAFWSGRARGGARFRLGDFRLEGTIQAAGSLSLPENGSAGPGVTTYRANGGDREPGRVSLLELNLVYQGPRFNARLGRMGYADGNEKPIPVDRLDQIKRRRINERLLGNWDWTNVGRRYDGAAVGLDMTLGRIDAMYLIPLAGGFNYRDAGEWIDDYHVFGLSFVNQYGSALPGAELRFAAYQVLDDRPVLKSGFWEAPGEDIDLTTAVLSLVGGGASNDILFWIAFQTGDWGLRSQDAVAFLAELGWQFGGAWRPQVRGGFQQASGWDGDDVKHRTFYNLLPTNHKYYGALDLNAFQNLRDARVEFAVDPHPRLNARLTAHGFWLLHRTDAWYGGSGVYDTDDFGYVARRPVHGGDFGGSNIGAEIDLDFAFILRGKNKVEFGGAGFWGGKVAEETYPTRSNALWAYLQLSLAI